MGFKPATFNLRVLNAVIRITIPSGHTEILGQSFPNFFLMTPFTEIKKAMAPQKDY